MVIRSKFPADRVMRLAYNLLQASRVRSTKTEYIACTGWVWRSFFSLWWRLPTTIFCGSTFWTGCLTSSNRKGLTPAFWGLTLF